MTQETGFWSPVAARRRTPSADEPSAKGVSFGGHEVDPPATAWDRGLPEASAKDGAERLPAPESCVRGVHSVDKCDAAGAPRLGQYCTWPEQLEANGEPLLGAPQGRFAYRHQRAFCHLHRVARHVLDGWAGVKDHLLWAGREVLTVESSPVKVAAYLFSSSRRRGRASRTWQRGRPHTVGVSILRLATIGCPGLNWLHRARSTSANFWMLNFGTTKSGALKGAGVSHDSPRAQTCTFQHPGLQKHHQNLTKGPQERERRMKIVAGEGKKRAKFWAVRRRVVQRREGPAEGFRVQGSGFRVHVFGTKIETEQKEK